MPLCMSLLFIFTLLGKISIPEVIFWFVLVKITSGILTLPNTNLFGKLNNLMT